MRQLLLIVVVVGAGCFSPNYGNGHLRCEQSDKPCPDGYHCATDGTCWQDGQDPTTTPDLSAATEDMAPPDLAGSDLIPPPDLLPPPVVLFPPAAVWITSAGGPITATSGTELNFSVGGTVLVGGATGSNAATITYGYLSSDTY